MSPAMREFRRPHVLEVLGFEGADLWGGESYEQFSHKLPLDYVLETLDGYALDRVGNAAEFLRSEPMWLTVAAYKRGVVSQHCREMWSESLVEHLREMFSEEHGHFDDGDDRLSDHDLYELQQRSVELVDWYVERATVFPCELVRKFTLDSEDIIEIIEQCRPGWLKPKAAP